MMLLGLHKSQCRYQNKYSCIFEHTLLHKHGCSLYRNYQNKPLYIYLGNLLRMLLYMLRNNLVYNHYNNHRRIRHCMFYYIHPYNHLYIRQHKIFDIVHCNHHRIRRRMLQCKLCRILQDMRLDNNCLYHRLHRMHHLN